MDATNALKALAIDCLTTMKTGEQLCVAGYGAVKSLPNGYEVGCAGHYETFIEPYHALDWLYVAAKAARERAGVTYDEPNFIYCLVSNAMCERRTNPRKK